MQKKSSYDRRNSGLTARAFACVCLFWGIASTGLAGAGEKTAAAAAPGATPRLVCAEPVFDFGRRRDQETVKHTFVIENKGNADLRLLSVRTSCGCTTAEVSRDTVPPGQSAEVHAAFVLRGRRGQETKKVYVRTNDPKTPTLVCTLQGVVTKTFLLEPQKLNFRPRSRDDEEGWVKRVYVAIESSRPWEVVKLEVPDPVFFSAEVIEQKKTEAEIEVRLKKDYFIDHADARGNLVIHTTHAKYARLYVPVRVRVTPVVRIRPSVLRLPPPERKSSRAGRKRMAAKSAEPYRDIVMRSEIPDSVELLEVIPPEGLETKVEVLPTYVIVVKGFDDKNREALKGKSIRIRALVEGKERTFIVPIEDR